MVGAVTNLEDIVRTIYSPIFFLIRFAFLLVCTFHQQIHYQRFFRIIIRVLLLLQPPPLHHVVQFSPSHHYFMLRKHLKYPLQIQLVTLLNLIIYYVDYDKLSVELILLVFLHLPSYSIKNVKGYVDCPGIKD